MWWNLLDIAYLVPGTVLIGYFIGKFLEDKYGGDYLTNSILIAAGLGFILMIYKLKKFIDIYNKELEKKRGNHENRKQ